VHDKDQRYYWCIGVTEVIGFIEGDICKYWFQLFG